MILDRIVSSSISSLAIYRNSEIAPLAIYRSSEIAMFRVIDIHFDLDVSSGRHRCHERDRF